MVEDARETVTDFLEAEAIRRAYEGSNALLTFLLRRWRPGKYGHRKDMRPHEQDKKTIISTVNVEDILVSVKEPNG